MRSNGGADTEADEDRRTCPTSGMQCSPLGGSAKGLEVGHGLLLYHAKEFVSEGGDAEAEEVPIEPLFTQNRAGDGKVTDGVQGR